MSYDTIHIWKICQSCHKFSLLGEEDWRTLPPFGGLSKAVKQLSKKTCCKSCIGIMMKGGDVNEVSDGLPVRAETGTTSGKGESIDKPVSNVWDLL